MSEADEKAVRAANDKANAAVRALVEAVRVMTPEQVAGWKHTLDELEGGHAEELFFPDEESHRAAS